MIRQIKKDIMQAKVAKDKVKSLLLATLYGEAISIGKNDGNRETTDEEVLKLITKFVKNTKELISLGEKSSNLSENAIESIAKAKIELSILNGYLPQQMSEMEIVAAVEAIVQKSGANSMKQMGLVMKELKGQYDGKYDGKLASKIVRDSLA